MLDLDNAPLRKSVRPLPKRINGHVLSIADLKTIAQHYAGRPDPILGEELVGHIIPGMFDRESGRHIPAEVLHHIGEGSAIAGKKVLLRFLSNIRHGDRGHFARGGAVTGKVSKESVNFRQAENNEFCARCTMFRQPSSCTAVAGRIHRVDLCDLYEQAP